MVFARDEVVILSVNQQPLGECDPRLVLTRAVIGDLIALSLRHPELSESVTLARARFEAGDLCYLACFENQPAHMAWIGTRTQISAPVEVGAALKIELPVPAAYVYDCWTAPELRGRGIYPAVLRKLIGRGLEKHPEVWIGSRRDNAASLRGIEKAGFRPRFRMTRIRLLHRFNWSWIHHADCRDRDGLRGAGDGDVLCRDRQ
jgi:GNAT superfamily N-acetyltransferase